MSLRRKLMRRRQELMASLEDDQQPGYHIGVTEEQLDVEEAAGQFEVKEAGRIEVEEPELLDVEEPEPCEDDDGEDSGEEGQTDDGDRQGGLLQGGSATIEPGWGGQGRLIALGGQDARGDDDEGEYIQVDDDEEEEEEDVGDERLGNGGEETVPQEMDIEQEEDEDSLPKVSFMRARKLIRVSKEWLARGLSLEDLQKKRAEPPPQVETPEPRSKRQKFEVEYEEEEEEELVSEEAEEEDRLDEDYQDEEEGDGASSSDSMERGDGDSSDTSSEASLKLGFVARGRRKGPPEEDFDDDDDDDDEEEKEAEEQPRGRCTTGRGAADEVEDSDGSIEILEPTKPRFPTTPSPGPRKSGCILGQDLLGKIIYVYDTDNWYKSKIIACESTRIQIHFVGWNKKYDKWISKSSGLIMLEEEFLAMEAEARSPAPAAPKPKRQTPVEERSEAESDSASDEENSLPFARYPAKGRQRGVPRAGSRATPQQQQQQQPAGRPADPSADILLASQSSSSPAYGSSSSALVSNSPTSPTSTPAASSFAFGSTLDPGSPGSCAAINRNPPRSTGRRPARSSMRSSSVATPENAGSGASTHDDNHEDGDYFSETGESDDTDDDDAEDHVDDTDSDSDLDSRTTRKRSTPKPRKKRAKASKVDSLEQQQPQPVKGKRGRKPNKKQSNYMKKKEERMRLLQLIQCPPDREFVDYYSCDQCDEPIQFLRFSCCYCGSPDHPDMNTYDLCESCFRYDFPSEHDHPQTSFVIKSETLDGSLPERYFIPDKIDEEYVPNYETSSSVLTIKERQNRVCCLCAEDEDYFDGEDESIRGFIGDGKPIVVDVKGKVGKKSVWVHKACALACHTVRYKEETDTWYNVAIAVINGKITKCHHCQLYGASINCMDPSCKRYFHLPCSGTPVTSFQRGLVFFCPSHQQDLRDEYENKFHCDSCEKPINPAEHWFRCQQCKDYWSSYDLCRECYEQNFPREHEHGKEDFEETDQEKFRRQDEEYEVASGFQNPAEKRPAQGPSRRGRKKKVPSCRVCNSRESVQWRKDSNNTFVCNVCFDRANQDSPAGEVCSIGDYIHQPYLTRTSCSATPKPPPSDALYLPSYGPQPDQLFSLGIPVTFFDIPGRAPRWASHSSHDYSGTWIPQITRWTLQRFTLVGEPVISNFLGRGTDAIEAFLINRPLFGVDINPVAVSLTQKNCSFAIPPELQDQIRASSRPKTFLGSATALPKEIFKDESFGHVLSHPPYHRCIVYSSNIEGDLSRLPSVDAFCEEMFKVAKESYRVLKPTRRCTVGIGDNREHCLVLPVAFSTIRTYLNAGFEIEELILKRQRCCSGTSKGASLSIVHDFLIITHEYLIVFKKPAIPLEAPETQFAMDLSSPVPTQTLRQTRTVSVIPEKNLAGQSLVVGTCWTFRDSPAQPLEAQTLTRMVERFGVEGKPIECVGWQPVDASPPAPQLVPADGEQVPENDDDEVQEYSDSDDNLRGDEGEEPEELSAYERERQKRIAENNDFLRRQGLISNEKTSHETVDKDLMKHLVRAKETSKQTPTPAPKKLSLLFVHATSHLPNREAIREYRMQMLALAKEAVNKLFIGGYLILGVRDVRIVEGDRQILFPMGMLVCEDLENLRSSGLVLKEIVGVVSSSHSKNRHSKEVCVTEYVGQTPEKDIKHLPIVHTFYLVYARKKV